MIDLKPCKIKFIAYFNSSFLFQFGFPPNYLRSEYPCPHPFILFHSFFFSSLTSVIFISLFKTSIHLLFSLSLPFFLSIYTFLYTITASASLFPRICLHHLNTLSHISSRIGAIPLLHLMISFLILFSPVTPRTHRNILIPVTLIFCSIFYRMLNTTINHYRL